MDQNTPDVQSKEPLKKGNVTKILNQISILGLFAVAGIIVLMLTGALVANRGLIVALAVFGFICLGSILATPWVRYLERGKYKTLSWVFVGFIILCVLLWIIGTFVVNTLIIRINANTATESFAYGVVQFLRITLVITLQFITANFISTNVIRYGKRMIVFQGIAYASYAYADLYLSMLACCFVIKNVGGKAELYKVPAITDFVFARLAWTLLILALVWIIVANTIVNNTNKNGELRRNDRLDRNGRPVRRGITSRVIGRIIDREDRMDEDEALDASNNQPASQAAESNDTSAKLAKLKEMYDQGLLTKEEYDAKRQKLVDEL